MQNDFCEGGSLAVAGGADVAGAISRYVARTPTDGTPRSWPPRTGTTTRAPTSPTPPTTSTAGRRTAGSAPTARSSTRTAEPAFEHVQAVFRKGVHAGGVQRLRGVTPEGDRQVPLADWLRERAIEDVDVVGIATDHCVRATALDAAAEGFGTTVLLGLTAGVARESTDRALAQLREAGVELDGEPYVGSAGVAGD